MPSENRHDVNDDRVPKRRLRVLLFDSYPPLDQASMRRYADLLERELPAVGVDVVRRRAPVVLGRLPLGRGVLSQLARFVDLFVLGPIPLRRAAAAVDVVHICDHTNAMYRLFLSRGKAIVTCHDVNAILAARGAIPGVRKGYLARLHQRWIARNLARAAHIVCVSSETERELRRCVPGLRGHVAVIDNPLPWPYAPVSPREVSEVLERFGVRRAREYFLHVGGNDWYKNRMGAMRIFAELQRQPRFQEALFVMVGAPFTAQMHAFRSAAGMEDRIVELTNVTSEDLGALYSGAFALLFPSRREGFGWPIVEANACGCAVITSDRAPMTDVGGDAAIYIKPDDPAAAVAAICARLAELPMLRERARANAARYPVHAAMQKYADLYADVVAGAAS